MGIEYREKILNLARQKGPLLPNDVAKLLKTSTLFASAMLSEMNENKLLVISSLKVGGSPLYYIPDQVFMLEHFLEKLNEKDRRVFELLKQKKILKDSDQELLIRFSLRQLKDFAKPIHISKGDEAELYWKFYGISDEEALDLLRPKKVVQKVVQKVHHAPILKHQEPQKPHIQNVKSIQNVHVENPHLEHPPHVEHPHHGRQKKPVEEDELFIKVKKFCDQKNIALEKIEVITRNKDIEFVGRVPNSVGSTSYFVKAKSKKSISDIEIAAVYAKSSVRSLPALFLIDGHLSKKAQEALASYPSVTVQHFSDGS